MFLIIIDPPGALHFVFVRSSWQQKHLTTLHETRNYFSECCFTGDFFIDF